ncbi:MAG: ADP-ribosylglycohydrolase family protein [Trueperaceae bacterium]
MNAIERAKVSLEGLYTGDTFGQQFFGPEDRVIPQIQGRVVPESPWRYTDDTQMALSIVATLQKFGEIKQDFLANHFAKLYARDSRRGYGGSMHDTLSRIGAGEFWQIITRSAFDGMGSFGNGAAMRISPLGAYFAEDLPTVVKQSTLSSEVTHAHPEAAAGAIGVAIATALAYQWGLEGKLPNPKDFLKQVAQWIPESEVKSKVLRASEFTEHTSMSHAVAILGNGVMVSAQDTVPLALWCAAKFLDNFPDSLWFTVSALGDRDTTCAMAGGIVVAYTGVKSIPLEWRTAREPLPAIE